MELKRERMFAGSFLNAMGGTRSQRPASVKALFAGGIFPVVDGPLGAP